MAKKPKEPAAPIELPPANDIKTAIPTEEQIMALLDPKKELQEGRPTANGLRRVIKYYTSFDIVGTEVNVVQSPNPENRNRTTVTCKISYIDRNNNPEFVRTLQDAADCNYENTKAPFNKFPTATASTMAEGRCYRKLLNLNTITAEESIDQDPQILKQIEDEENSVKSANDNQITTIKNMCAKFKIHPHKILEVFEKTEVPEDLKQWNAKWAHDTIQYLWKFNRNTKPGDKDYLAIPDEIKIK
jgi:hypothetical protein